MGSTAPRDDATHAPVSRRARREAERTRRRSGQWAARGSLLAALSIATVAVPVLAGPGQVAGALEDGGPTTVQALTASTGTLTTPTSLLSSTVSLARSVDVSRSTLRDGVEGCDGDYSGNASNGRLPADDLCLLWDGVTAVRADVASSITELNDAYRARFGTDLCLASGYRTWGEQAVVNARKGYLAAAPGRSNHGFGIAIDLCTSQTKGDSWTWLNETAPVYGWVNPSWARPGGAGPYERWHWEYLDATTALGTDYSS